MSKQTFPTFVDQPGCIIRNFGIDGSAVGASASTDGLDGRGKFLCTISKSSNVVTIDWNSAFGDVPYVFFQPAVGQTDTIVELVSSSTSQMVFQTVKATDNSGVNDADLDVVVFGYNTTSYVS